MLENMQVFNIGQCYSAQVPVCGSAVNINPIFPVQVLLKAKCSK